MNNDNLMEKVSAFGERLKIGGTEVGRKVTEGMTSMSFKMKEFFNGPNESDKIVEAATSEALDGPDWAANLEICDAINTERLGSGELIRAIKKRIVARSNSRVQYLGLVLLETCVKNCEKAFAEVVTERVLDEMVKAVDDPMTVVENRNKLLVMIEAWGEARDELRYLPVFEETYKSLKSRGIRFPGRDNESLAPIFTPPSSVTEAQSHDNSSREVHRDVPVESFTAEQIKEAFDVARNSIELLTTVLSSSPQQDVLQDDLTTTLIQQCQQCQHTVQRIIETATDNEVALIEALNVNDELVKVLSKYDELKTPPVAQSEAEPAMIPVAVETEESPRVYNKEDALIRKPAGSYVTSGEDDMMDDLDEMIFGKKGGSSAQKDDLISF